MLARQLYAVRDIAGTGAADNQGGTLVNHAVPHSPGFVVAVMAWSEQFPTEDVFEFCNRRLVKDRAFLGGNRVCHGFPSLWLVCPGLASRLTPARSGARPQPRPFGFILNRQRGRVPLQRDRSEERR